VQKHARTGLVVQRAIRTAGHCEFSPTEVGTAWEDLVDWVTTGARPAGDAVSDPAAVAEPSFGCQFTNPAPLPPTSGSRTLFPPCT
jgi:hypothetical protein